MGVASEAQTTGTFLFGLIFSMDWITFWALPCCECECAMRTSGLFSHGCSLSFAFPGSRSSGHRA